MRAATGDTPHPWARHSAAPCCTLLRPAAPRRIMRRLVAPCGAPLHFAGGTLLRPAALQAAARRGALRHLAAPDGAPLRSAAPCCALLRPAALRYTLQHSVASCCIRRALLHLKCTLRHLAAPCGAPLLLAAARRTLRHAAAPCCAPLRPAAPRATAPNGALLRSAASPPPIYVPRSFTRATDRRLTFTSRNLQCLRAYSRY